MTAMKTHGEIVAEELRDDDFRREWERFELARAVAAMVVAYRSDHRLTQRALAERLGITQPRVARIESGEHNPTPDTLMLLAGRLDLELNISFRPAPNDTPEREEEHIYASSETVSETTHSALRFVASAA